MPAHRAFEDQIAALDALRQQPEPARLDSLRKALTHRNNFITAKAADLIREFGLQELTPDLLKAFDRFFAHGEKSDPQCWAKNAISRALAVFELQDADVFLRGMRHIQMEPVWGGRSDTAGTLRATCALALVQCRSLTEMNLLAHLIDLVVDKDKAVRTEVIRAIEQVGSPSASLLLRQRAMLGNDEPEVLGACFGGVLRVEGTRAIPWVGRFLASADDSAGEAALAIAGTRSPEAFAALRTALADASDPWFRSVLLSAIALTRDEAAIDFLLDLVKNESLDAETAIAALCGSAPSEDLVNRLKKLTSGNPRLAQVLENQNNPDFSQRSLRNVLRDLSGKDDFLSPRTSGSEKREAGNRSSNAILIAGRSSVPPERFRVALIQMSCGPEPEQNLEKAIGRIADAAGRGAQVVCLPELFQTQYFCQREDHALFDLAEPIPGPSSERLAAAARKDGVVLIASLFEKRAPGVYHNTAAIFDQDGSLSGLYRKMHIPDDPLYYEKFYFTPGDLGFRALNTSAGKLGTLVCWDQWYPEGARLTALQGAQILFYPTAIGWHPAEKVEFGVAQHDAWRTIQRAHAIANGVYVAVVNRVGFETGNVRGKSAPGHGLEFWGGSFFCDPFGRVLAEGSHDREEILVGDVDIKALEDIRRNWPFLRDRRIDSYAPITNRLID